MIVAAWHRWQQGGGWKWLIFLGAFIVFDALIGSTLLAWEIRMLKEYW